MTALAHSNFGSTALLRERCSDDVLGVITLARAGIGLIQAFDFLVTEDIARGMVEVLAALWPIALSRAARAPTQFKKYRPISPSAGPHGVWACWWAAERLRRRGRSGG